MLTCTAKTLDAGLKSLQAKAAPHFVHFHAPWCGDCKRTDAGVDRAAAKLQASVLRVDVGDRDSWRAPNHPLRLDPRVQLRCIPTLVQWFDDKAIARVESALENAASASAAEDVAVAFMRKAQAA